MRITHGLRFFKHFQAQFVDSTSVALKPSSAKTAIAFSTSKSSESSVQVANFSEYSTFTFTTPGSVDRLSLTVATHPTGHVMPEMLSVTTWASVAWRRLPSNLPLAETSARGASPSIRTAMMMDDFMGVLVLLAIGPWRGAAAAPFELPMYTGRTMVEGLG